MRPLKADFPNFVQFTTNIEDRILYFHIQNAFVYELKPLMGDIAGVIDSYVEPDPIPDPVDDTYRPQLQAFFDNYVKRWWILLAYKRFLQNHGRNVTQFGYTQLQDPAGTFSQVSSEDRAVELRQIANDANVSQTFVFNQIWTFDEITYKKPGDEYGCEKGRSKSFGISAIR